MNRLMPALLLMGSVAAAELQVSVTPEPAGEIVVGQQVRLNVLIETDTWFTSAPRYPEMKLDGAIVLMPDAFGVNSTRREGATTWAGQTRRYVLFPQRAGILSIPPVEVQLAVAADGKPGVLQTIRTPALELTVVLPDGAGNEEFVTTSRYALQDEWDRSLDELQVADELIYAFSF